MEHSTIQEGQKNYSVLSFDENTAKAVWATPLPCLSKGNVKK